MTIQFDHPLTAGTVLVISAIQSPDYVAGTSGWIIRQDGSVEFNSGDFRGTITAAQIIGSVFGTSNTDPSIWINEDNANTIRVYDADSNTVVEMGAGQGETGGVDFTDGSFRTGIGGNLIDWQHVSANVYQSVSRLRMNSDASALLWGSFFGGGVALHIASGSWVRLQPGGSDVLQSWQIPSPTSGWALGSTASSAYQPLRYTITPQNELWLYGAAHVTTTTPSNTVFVLPAGYTPSPTGGSGTATIFPAGSLTQVTSADAIKATGRLNIQSNGVVVVGGFTFAANDSFYFNHKIPMGNTP